MNLRELCFEHLQDIIFVSMVMALFLKKKRWRNWNDTHQRCVQTRDLSTSATKLLTAFFVMRT